MIFNRIIPSLLLHQGGLVKTIKFKKPNYIGDPINAVKIFNDKEVDELMFLDIDATVERREPNYTLIEEIASECFIPLCYGGGVKSIEQMKRIFAIGVEKISLSSIAIDNPNLIKEASELFGSQSIVVMLDIKKPFWGANSIYTHRGKKNRRLNPVAFAKQMEALGVGELVINSIDNDGLMQGYDMRLLLDIKKAVNIPVIGLGGAGSLEDMRSIIKDIGLSAAAAGSLFVYQGALNAVLINYPEYKKIRELLKD